MNKNILISGFYGFGNAGDEAILYSMVKSFKKELPDVTISVLSAAPIEELVPFGVNFVPRKNIFAIFKAMLKADLFISGGGGLIQDVTSLKSIKYYLGLINMAKLFGKKVLIYAQGIGPVNTPIGKKLARKTLNKADYITVRDEYSKEFLENLGLKNTLIEVTADPVVLLDEKKDITPLLNKYGISKTNINLGVSIRPWTVDYLPKVAGFLGELWKKHPEIRQYLIPFQISQDMEFCLKLQGMLSHKTEIISEKLNTQELVNLISNFDYVIAMRLHAAIMAAANNIPAVGLIYDPKVKSFFELVKLPAIGLSSLEGSLLNDKFEYLTQNKEKIKTALANIVSVLKGKAKRNVEVVKQLLRD